MNANWKFEAIADYARKRLDIAVLCRNCGRTAVYDPTELFRYFMARRWSTRSLDPRHFTCRCKSKDILVQAIGNEHRPAPLPNRPPVLQPVYLRLGYGWRKNHPPEPFEPSSIALLRQLQVEDPSLSFAWRVKQARDCFQAEVRCAPDIGTGAGFHGKGPSERAALAVAVRDAVRTWRHPMSRRHIHPEISPPEINLLEAEQVVMTENLNGALDGGAYEGLPFAPAVVHAYFLARSTSTCRIRCLSWRTS